MKAVYWSKRHVEINLCVSLLEFQFIKVGLDGIVEELVKKYKDKDALLGEGNFGSYRKRDIEDLQRQIAAKYEEIYAKYWELTRDKED